jgi:hypothetical protein
MSAHNLTFRLGVLGAFVVCAVATAYGCSSSGNSNPTPTTFDGGNDATSSSSSGSGSSSGSSSDSGGGGNDAPSFDTGSCVSDASTCNSCYSATQASADPLNACASSTVNCIPFTLTVPTHPTL